MGICHLLYLRKQISELMESISEPMVGIDYKRYFFWEKEYLCEDKNYTWFVWCLPLKHTRRKTNIIQPKQDNVHLFMFVPIKQG